MLERKNEKIPLMEGLVAECENSYNRWQDIYENGCSDPFWEDGLNLNIIRNHITYYRNKIKDLCERSLFERPEILLREIPPKVDNKYMAKSDYIKQKGKELYAKLISDKAFSELQGEMNRLTDKQKNSNCFLYVAATARNLKTALDNNELVKVRNILQNEADIFEKINNALDAAKDLPTVPKQLSLLDIT